MVRCFSHNAAAFSFNAWLHPPSRNLLFLSQHFLNFPGNFTLTRKKSNNHVPDCSHTTFLMSTRIICVQPMVLHLCIGRLLHLQTFTFAHWQTFASADLHFPLSQTPFFSVRTVANSCKCKNMKCLLLTILPHSNMG